MKSSRIYETDEDLYYEYWSSLHISYATLFIINSLHNKFMNLLHLPEKYHILLLESGVGTCVIGQGWEDLSLLSLIASF
jgi:hypothetical protein